MELEVRQNTDLEQFEARVEEKLTYIEYKLAAGNRIFLTHTEVPTALEGKGIGSALVGKVLAQVKENGWQLVPLCPFVASYIRKHPEWKKLIAKGINI